MKTVEIVIVQNENKEIIQVLSNEADLVYYVVEGENMSDPYSPDLFTQDPVECAKNHYTNCKPIIYVHGETGDK